MRRCLRLTIFPAVALICSLSGGGAFAAQLSQVWGPAIRSTIPVYLCTTSFQNNIPDLGNDTVRLRATTAAAIDEWNTRTGADFRFVLQSGEPPGGDGCGSGEAEWPTGDYVTIRGEGDAWATACGGVLAGADEREDAQGDTIRARIVFFRDLCDRDGGGQLVVWTYDSTTDNNPTFPLPYNVDFYHVLLHELGHTVGFEHQTDDTHSVMTPGAVNSEQMVLWWADIKRTTDSTASPHYELDTTRVIEHRRSTDSGQSWVDETMSGAPVSNDRIGVASNGAGTYVDRRVKMFTTNGVTPPANNYGTGFRSYGGPSVAFGNGLFVVALAYASTSSNFLDRRIAWWTSDDIGLTWRYQSFLKYRFNDSDTPISYGSKWEPELAYNTADDRFVLAFTQLEADKAIAQQGRISTCVNAAPDVQDWEGCYQLSTLVSQSPPGLACNAEGVDHCVLRHTPNDAAGAYELRSVQGSLAIGTPDYFYAWGNVEADIDSSRLGVTLAHGEGFYVTGWRGDDGSTWGNAARMSDTGWPNWIDHTFPKSLLLASPQVAFDAHWGEFAYYYVRR